MIQCKSIYENAEESDGCRILVARFVPKSVLESGNAIWDIHLPQVAPSQKLLQPFKLKEIKFPIFIKIFLEEMDQLCAHIGVKTIACLSMVSTVTLLCYEKTDTFCHRRFVEDIVKDVLTKSNFDFERIWHFDVSGSVGILKKRYEQKIREAEKEVEKEEKKEEVNKPVDAILEDRNKDLIEG